MPREGVGSESCLTQPADGRWQQTGDAGGSAAYSVTPPASGLWRPSLEGGRGAAVLPLELDQGRLGLALMRERENRCGRRDQVFLIRS